jgi:hypothetical protein
MTGRKISGKGARMKHANFLLRVFPAFACLAALAACAPTPPLVTNCPNVAKLEEGSTMTEFLPGRQDVAAEITEARITGVAGSCIEERKKHLLRVTFQTGFAATNGPANTSQTLVLPYLISISQGDTIYHVTPRSIALSFDGNASTASATSPPQTVELPNTPESASIDVLVSFHLTPDQIAYNAAHPSP